MAQHPIMPVATDALIGDTTHLSTEEFGAYLLILIATWRNNGCPLPDDDVRLSRICRCGSNRWSTKIKPRLVEFFDISDGYWHQKRLESTWCFVKNRREQQSAKGKRSAELRALKNNETLSTVAPTERQPPNPNPNPIKKESPNGDLSKSARQIATAMMAVWEDIVGKVLPVPRHLTQQRLQASRVRFTESFGADIEKWRAFVTRIAAAPLLIGDNGRGWRADYDWVLKPANLAKILEGNYDRKPNGLDHGLPLRTPPTAAEREAARQQVLAELRGPDER